MSYVDVSSLLNRKKKYFQPDLASELRIWFNPGERSKNLIEISDTAMVWEPGMGPSGILQPIKHTSIDPGVGV